MQNETPADVLSRIRKLMKLAGNNPNANEAALAAAKAQELMLRWKLDCASIDLGEETPEQEKVEGYYSHDPLFTGVRIAAWRIRLFTTICNYNACKPIITTARGGSKRGSDLRIIGARTNVEMVRWLLGYVAAEIDRLAVAARPAGMSRGEAKSWSNEFRHGAVVGVGRSLFAMHEKVRAEYRATTTGTQALIVLDQDAAALKAYIKESGEKFRSRTTPTGNYNDASARRAGERAGGGISLNPPLSGGKARRQLTAKGRVTPFYVRTVKRYCCKCARCGHSWETETTRKPKRCAACKSPYWNTPRGILKRGRPKKAHAGFSKPLRGDERGRDVLASARTRLHVPKSSEPIREGEKGR